MTATASLLAANRITRHDLADLPAPTPQGPRHHPRSHRIIVEGIHEALTGHGLEVVDEQLALSGKDNSKLLGTLKVRPTSGHSLLSATRPDSSWALAFRSSQDRSWGLTLVSGMIVMVCQNGLLSGEHVALKRRHCRGLDLGRELDEAIERYLEQQVRVVEMADAAKHERITDTEAKGLICDAFADPKLNISSRLFRPVVDNYWSPRPEWTDITAYPRSRWALHNAFTRSLRSSSPSVRYRVTRGLANLLRPGWPDTN